MVVRRRDLPTGHRPRRDAVRSREALISAASRLLATRGPDVPLVEVARAAQVGQGTLYRHFRDRDALLRACAELELEAFDGAIAEYCSGAEPLQALFVDAVDHFAGPSLLLELGRLGGGNSEVRRFVRRRMSGGFGELVARAVALGQLRVDLTGADILLVFDMVAGALGDDELGPDGRRELTARALDVALSGLLRR